MGDPIADWVQYASHAMNIHLRSLLSDEMQATYDSFPPHTRVGVAVFITSLIALFITGELIATVFGCCKPAPPAKALARNFDGEISVHVPRDVLICTACKLKLDECGNAAVAKHRAGKRHRKSLAEGKTPDDEHSLFIWDRASKWVKTDEEEEEACDGIRTLTADEAAALALKSAQKLALGKGVAAAAGREAEAAELQSGGWRRVGASASKTGKNGSSGDDANAYVKDITANMLHVDAGRNILEGFVVNSRFLTTGAEFQLRQWIEQAVRSGQGSKLRGNTYTHPRPIPNTSGPGVPAAQAPLTLNYGCYYDIVSHAVVPSKLVEPLPPQLVDLAKRIAARGPHLAGTKQGGLVPDCATIVELQPGQYINPHCAALEGQGQGFAQPAYWLCIEGMELDVLMGSSFTRVAGAPAGSFSASFCHRFAPRSLLAFRGTAAEPTKAGIPSVSERTLLIIFRNMQAGLRSEMEARGNTVA